MQELITIFHAKKTTSKTPISPYEDNTFVFETHKHTSNFEMFSTMVSHFILNIPLAELKKPIRTFRRKANLGQYYAEKLTYLILDIDDVKSDFTKHKILDYFKDYKVILGESKSYNGISNFNMKGLLFTEEIDINDAKLAISAIHHDLKEYCTMDECVARRAALNAPIMKNKIFLNNEDGLRYKLIKKSAIDHINDIRSEYIGEGININISELDDLQADSMEKLCLKVFKMMGYSATTNNANGSISFKHPSEKKTPGGYFWFSSSPYTMHHGNSTKSVNIFEYVRKLPAAKELMKKDINYDSEFLNFNTDMNALQVNEQYLTVNDGVKHVIDDFLSKKNGLLSIRSPMGTGKSTIINHVIEECHGLDMKVLIITNRISVAQDFGKKYNMKLYNQDKYEIGDSLVCQYDSLWKFNIKFFDIVIMDEFISLMLHSRSNLNNSSINIAKFFGAFNKKLVIADAFLTGYENFLLSNKESNLHMIDNIYRDPTTLYNYDDFNYFVNNIVLHAERAKLTISATSLSFINSLQLLLTKRGLKVVTLTADTPDSTKKLIYDLFEENEHDKWDVLIYSPTLTVGVSNLNNVKYHFHYDSSMSTDAISSLQMIKRTRKTKEIHFYIKERLNYLKTTYNDIRDEYMGNIGKNIEQNYLFDVDDYGEARLSNIGKNAIKIDTFKNILEYNHKASMMWLLKYHFLNEPKLIDATFSSNLLIQYQKQVKTEKRNVLMNNLEQFLALNEIEKTELLMNTEADKIMRALAEIDMKINDCDSKTKSKILELTLNDPLFIQKCRYYNITVQYTTKDCDDDDIKYLVSKAITQNMNDDLYFYNMLLDYGQNKIFDEYKRSFINNNKKLKYILDKCGYNFEKLSAYTIVGSRAYQVNPEIKKLSKYIK